jgi:hypothetical protein
MKKAKTQTGKKRKAANKTTVMTWGCVDCWRFMPLEVPRESRDIFKRISDVAVAVPFCVIEQLEHLLPMLDPANRTFAERVLTDIETNREKSIYLERPS